MQLNLLRGRKNPCVAQHRQYSWNCVQKVRLLMQLARQDWQDEIHND